MFSPEVARQLRRRSHHVVAASEQPHLAEMDDPALFEAAQDERRAVVTENVPDFLRLDRHYRQQGRAHFGLILTSNRRFPRGSSRSIGRLVLALEAFLLRQRGEQEANSLVHWL